MKTPPHPPDETAEELRAALARNHPELSEADLDALLGGPPNKRYFRLSKRPRDAWRAGARGKGNGLAAHKRGRRKK